MSVACAVGAGASPVAASAAWKRWLELPERTTITRPPLPPRRRDGADRATRRRGSVGGARASLRVDPRAQAGGASTSVGGALRERDRTLLLGEPVGELRRRRHPRLERGAPLRRKRSVRERRQLGELLIAALLVPSALPHRHSNLKGNAGRPLNALPGCGSTQRALMP